MSSLILQEATGPAFHAPKILIVVMGVAGTGKSTLGAALARSLNLPFIEGDALHPKANVDKMSVGIPLTDADREPWLRTLRATAEQSISKQYQLIQGDEKHENHGPIGVVVSCSALKSYYRDILRKKRWSVGEDEGQSHDDEQHAGARTFFVYIEGTRELMEERISKRTDHFMKPAMLESQLATLENPLGEEDVIAVPLAGTTEEQIRTAREGLNALIGASSAGSK
ncbi:hypothetical protein AX16_002071 [Volvariella volvacea WC 439]|nr:hypothetical protein AX16_002071 [Volvariella volvacea WC 439]